MSKLSAPGYARYAKEFYESALAADDVLGMREGYEIIAPIPVMYMAGHSIELILKAYLIHYGVEEGKLKGIGHDLEKCHKKAKDFSLSDIVKLDSDDIEVLQVLNTLYKSKELNYLRKGVKTFPVFGPLQTLCKKLLDNICPVVGY